MIRVSGTSMKICLAAMFAVTAAWPSVVDATGFHPPIVLCDATGRMVVNSGGPISTIYSCAGCHDTQFIAMSNSHADVLGIAHAPMANLPGSQANRPADSVAVELNCFLCHLSNPDDEARRSDLQNDRASWASTATLAKTGLVARSSNGWFYRAEFFTSDGAADVRRLTIRRPTSDNCGLCHGQTHFDREPLSLQASLSQPTTATTGQIFSPQQIFESAIDLENKKQLTRSWDVHAERLLECIDCHHSINNPAFAGPAAAASPNSKRPDHLLFERREVDSPQFVFRPSHRLATGKPAQATAAESTGPLRLTMRGCVDCHDAEATHTWMPAASAHLASLSCEACHIPEAHAPAVRAVDWTLPNPDGEPTVQWRGVDGESKTRVTGFRPLLLPREEADGRTRLGPYNLIAAWYWVDGSSQPVRNDKLKDAMLDGNGYRPELATVLDTNRDGQVEPAERVLDTPEKVDVVRSRLLAVGVAEPRIEVELRPYAVHHGVVGGEWAVAECTSCHAADSRLGETVVLASYLPGNVQPDAEDGAAAGLSGRFEMTDAGQYVYRPSAGRTWLYVPGYSRWVWIDMLGGITLLGAVVAIGVHSAVRLHAGRRRQTKMSDSQREDR